MSSTYEMNKYTQSLELQAVVMLSRLVNTIKENFEIRITSTFLWTMSKIVLLWFRFKSISYKTCVPVKTGEITKITDISNLHWVPREENVADEVRETKI